MQYLKKKKFEIIYVNILIKLFSTLFVKGIIFKRISEKNNLCEKERMKERNVYYSGVSGSSIAGDSSLMSVFSLVASIFKFDILSFIDALSS